MTTLVISDKEANANLLPGVCVRHHKYFCSLVIADNSVINVMLSEHDRNEIAQASIHVVGNEFEIITRDEFNDAFNRALIRIQQSL